MSGDYFHTGDKGEIDPRWVFLKSRGVKRKCSKLRAGNTSFQH